MADASEKYHRRFPAPAVKPTLSDYAAWLEKNDIISRIVEDALELAHAVQTGGALVAYISGALTHASDADKHRYLVASELCAANHIFGYVPHLTTDLKKYPERTPTDVRAIDYLWAVAIADFHINFLSPVAHGNGIEEGWAEGAHLPVIYCAPQEMTVSRLVRGMLNVYTEVRYAELENCYEKLAALLQKLAAYMRRYPHKGAIEFFMRPA